MKKETIGKIINSPAGIFFLAGVSVLMFFAKIWNSYGTLALWFFQLFVNRWESRNPIRALIKDNGQAVALKLIACTFDGDTIQEFIDKETSTELIGYLIEAKQLRQTYEKEGFPEVTEANLPSPSHITQKTGGP